MKSLALALALLFCSASALATSVSYSTSGVFTSVGTNSVTEGGATISFAGVAANVGVPTFSSLGTFNVVSDVSGGSFTDNFILTITQTTPSSGSSSSATTVDGTITGNSNTILLTFAPSDVLIGQIDYMFSPASYGLNNPSVNGGNTTIQAYVSTVPEPGSLSLLVGPLLGLGLLSRRRLAVKN
jgi:hypothetical protein